jgi:hypothetical protein
VSAGASEWGAFLFVGRNMRNRKAEKPKSEQRKIHRKPLSYLLEQIENLFGSQTTKATLADYVRLIQLELELIDDEPERSVVVQWKDLIAA